MVGLDKKGGVRAKRGDPYLPGISALNQAAALLLAICCTEPLEVTGSEP